MTTLRPPDIVPDGTHVKVVNKGKAVVVSHSWERDQHGNPIVVHLLQYPDGKVKPCNYSFILIP